MRPWAFLLIFLASICNWSQADAESCVASSLQILARGEAPAGPSAPTSRTPPYKLLVTHPLSPEGILGMSLKKSEGPAWLQPLIGKFGLTEIYEGHRDGRSFLYLPEISTRQKPDEALDPMLSLMEEVLSGYKPDVLVVGNNAVPAKAISSWRASIGEGPPLLVIRRGVDTRAINKLAAQENNVMVGNLPGVNSPYVAKTMIRHLNLEKAAPGDKIAVIGVGGIGKPIVDEAIAHRLRVVVYSPSLADAATRASSLRNKGLDPTRISVASSLDEALQGAKYLAISVPYESPGGTRQDGIFTLAAVQKMASQPTVVSCSIPNVLSPEALKHLDGLAAQGQAKVQIDTAKRHALELREHYPHIHADYDKAFADPACQRDLDRCFLGLADQVMLEYKAERVGLESQPTP